MRCIRALLFLCISFCICVCDTGAQYEDKGTCEDIVTLAVSSTADGTDLSETFIHSGDDPLRAGVCTSYEDCKNYADCNYKNGSYVCDCYNGTSGVYCEIVDECVQNPDKCGPDKKVECVFSRTYKEAVCRCPKSGQEYDFDDKKCKDCDCGTLAKCYFVDGNKTCDCSLYKNQAIKNGRCEYCFCSDNAIDCWFDDGGSQKCTCQRGYAPYFDWCYSCDCGPNGSCYFPKYNKVKTCNCDPNFSPDDGVCKECICGDDAISCSFGSKGEKRCGCKPGFEDKVGTCTECDCGMWSDDCKFSRSGKKLCTCKDGFAPIGDTCKECDCGANGRCYFNGTDKVCDCDTKYKMLDGYCQECFCGFEGTCKFNEKGFKQCSCDPGFGRKDQECMPCNCGVEEAECFFGDESKRCACPEGYQDYNGFCEDLDECLEQPIACPSTAKCTNQIGSYVCTCKDGYKTKSDTSDPRIDGCEDVDECAAHPLICRSNKKMCINLPGTYTCVCKDGYKPKGDTCVRLIPGRTEGVPTSWRTGFIVIVSLIAGSIVGIGIAVFIIRRKQMMPTMESIQVNNYR